jgi:hypothetical protein
MKELLQKQRQLIAVYVVWFFMHLVFLFLSDKSRSENFWPFQGGRYSGALTCAYDFSEFLVYAIGPAVLIFAYLMFTKKD